MDQGADIAKMLSGPVAQAGFSLIVSSGIFVFVLLQRPRTVLHGLLISLLACFMGWSCGMLLLSGTDKNAPVAWAGMILTFGSIMVLPPLWLFLSARLAHVSIVLDRPRACLISLLVPSVFHFGAMLSDPWHGEFAAGVGPALFTTPVSLWTGPIFWIHTVWSDLLVMAGVGLCLTAARHCANPIERKRLLVVALAASVPLISVAVLISGVLPRGVTFTPADLGVSAILISIAVVHYRFLEASPIPAHAVIAHLRDALLLASPEGLLVDANPAAEVMLGRPLANVRGVRLRQLLDELAPRAELRAVPQVEGAGESREYEVKTANGRELHVSWVPIESAGGRLQGSMVVLDDRTEQYSSQRSRHHSQRMESLGVLAAGIAHEINNPLCFVRTNLVHLEGLADVVAKHADRLPEENREELLEMAEVVAESLGGVDRISSIVGATRRLSRVPRSHAGRVQINSLIDVVLQLAQLDQAVRSRVECVLAPDLPAVAGSEEQISQVILNLVINAKQATAHLAGGRIRIETLACGEQVELRVDDNGPGVPHRLREQIFAPFFTTKDPEEGTGLGLSIAFEIVEEHRGDLRVGDSDLGGARFTVQLPV